MPTMKVLCPQIGMQPFPANMTADTPPDWRCCKCGLTGHAKYEARGGSKAIALVMEETKAKRKKFKKGGKSKGKKKGGKGGDA